MDWVTFASNVISAMAWPSVLIVLLIIVRKQIVALVTRLEEITLPGGTKAKFERNLEAAREQSSGIEGPYGGEPQRTSNLHYGGRLEQTLDRYAKLANEFPEAAVIMSFKELDETILSLGMSVGLPERTKPIDIIRTLARRPSDYSVGFDESAVAAYQSLQRARNAAAHGGGADRIGPGASLDFVAQARVMTESVKHLLEHVPKRAVARSP